MAKRKHASIDTKLQAIEEVERSEKSKTEIAKSFGIPCSTLSTWLKNKDSLRQAQDSFAPARKRMRTAKHSDVESALLLWFRNARSSNIPISGPILQGKARELSKKLNIEDFHASDGWLDRFKRRHDINFRVISGESANVTSAQTDQWSTITLPKLLKDYAPRDIFNADETGLFFKLLPDKSLVFKGDSCHGGKRSKERLSVLPCANMTGTEKLPLLVIGKSQKPRCFKGVKTLPTLYRANKKAWMTSVLFIEWVRDQDRKFALQKRNVAVVIDNCPSHPHITGLKAIKLVFLPPNTTSRTQPMDQGIIANFKHHYKNILIQQLITAIDKQEQLAVSVLQAMHVMRQAWSRVTPSTISNCFAHCGFSTPDQPQPLTTAEDEDPDDDIPLATLLRQIQDAGFEVNGTANDYLTADEQLLTTEPLTDDSIIAQVQQPSEDHPEADSDSDDEIPPSKPPSHADAMTMCQQLRLYLQSHSDTDSFFPYVNNIEQFAARQKYCSKQQTKLTDFFM